MISVPVATSARRRTSPSVRRTRSTFLLAWASAFLLCLGWALTSPVSSGPDESGHIMKAAATVRGLAQGEPTGSQGITSFSLPADVADVGGPQTCYVGDPNRTADCAPDLATMGSAPVEVRSGVGSYNPLYYAAVGWPSLFLDGEAGVIGMRAVSAAVNAFFIALLFVVASTVVARPSSVAWVAVALTPMTYYLGGVINPNGVETTALAALAGLAWLVVREPDSPHLATRVAALAVAGVVAGNARTASPAFVAVVVVAVCLTAPWSTVRQLLGRRCVRIAASASIAGLAFAAGWTVLIAGPGGFIPSSGPERDSFVPAFVRTIASTGDYGHVVIGVTGWLDTHLPQPVYVGWTAAVGAVVVAALVAAGRRHLVGVLVLMAGFVLAPAFIQAPTAGEYGYIWQGRYGLPLFAAMVVVAGLAGPRLDRERTLRLVAVVASLAAVAQICSFLVTYKRYAVGIDASWRQFVVSPSWLAPGGLVVGPLVFALGALGILLSSLWIAGRDPVVEGDSYGAPAGPTGSRPGAGSATTLD